MTHPPLRRRHAGFTLIEIIVVVVILGLLATLVTANVFKPLDKAKTTKAGHDIRALAGQVKQYYLDHNRFPSTDEGLEALLAEKYIEQLPKDPWDRPYQYLQPGEHGEFDIFTLGADGQPGGEGNDADLGNWGS